MRGRPLKDFYGQALLVLPLAFSAVCTASSLPWNMQETAMAPEGRLTFLQKPWWPRARALKEGQSFRLDLNHDGRPDAIVTRQDGNIVEAIDDTGHAAEIWNQVSTAYVVSYHGTGIVDRMVVYIDNDGDGKADEMELRYYKDGYLRYAWFGENYDSDGAQIFSLKNWQYAGDSDFNLNKFRGNVQIYLNKYDPASGTWVPLSECPFAFWDIDHDGHGDVALRVSAAPLASLSGGDTDYANNYKYMWAPEAVPLERIGAVNMRLSYNIDPHPRHEPLDQSHYNFGFTSIGAAPYQYPGMAYRNPSRRPPQTVIRIDWKQGQAVAMHYPAAQTAFTWDESHSVRRWEGQFWVYERIYLHNTGGPTHRWNMRREFSGKPSNERQIYYSAADRRFHLFGSEQAWLEAGHLINDRKDLEFRWFDEDGDGYLDTEEVYQPDQPLPVRVSRFSPRARMAALDLSALEAEYNRHILPDAIAEDVRIITALKAIAPQPTAQAYEDEAARTEIPERRRYCLDIARELYFLRVRDTLLAEQRKLPYPDAPLNRALEQKLSPGSFEGGYSLGDSVKYWNLAMTVHRLTEAYGDGNFDTVIHILQENHR